MAVLTFLDAWDTHFRQAAAGLGWPLEGILRLFLAALAGGLVGLERELRGHQAGFRTNMLVCMGSALVMMISIRFADYPWKSVPGVNVNVDPARIAYGVMTGVGFLGAGTIMHSMGAVRGLTTAAGLWCVAAVGLSIGFGQYLLSGAATILVVLALSFMNYVEDWLPRRQHRAVSVRTIYEPGCMAAIVQRFKDAGFETSEAAMQRTPDLKHADIALQIAFARIEEFQTFQRTIEDDHRIELLSVKQVQKLA